MGITEAALIIGALAAATSAGVGIAGAAGAFDKKTGGPQLPDDPRVEEQRQRRLRAARLAKGTSDTVLTSVKAEPLNAGQSATLLGQAGSS